MLYENSNDRDQQHMATFQYEKHLQRLGVTPVRCVHTKQEDAQPYDAQVWIHGKWTTVLEVKCRNVSSQQISDWGGVVVEVERLQRLRKEFRRPRLDTGGYWKKEIVFLFRCMRDDRCFTIHIDQIVDAWGNLPDAPAKAMKDNHGKILAEKKGKLIPLNLMEQFV
jgi:hypothetical protein